MTRCGVARPRRPTAPTTALAGSTWLGMDQRLAVEAQLDALAALGREPVGVLDVVVDAVEDHLAGLPRREQRGGQVRHAAAGGRARAAARSSLARSLVPITSTATRGWAAMARTSKIAVGVSSIAQIGIDRRRARGVELRGDRRRRRPTESTFGTTTADGPAATAAARSSAPHSVSSPLQRIVSSRPPYSPDCTAATAFARASALASGATASSRSKMIASAGSVLRLLERPLVGGGHVEHGAARPEVVVHDANP